MKRQSVLYQIYVATCNLAFIGPIWVAFCALELGMSWTQIMVIEAISALTSFIAEIPSGALADRIGRKRCLLLGLSLATLSMLLLSVTRGWVMFLISDIICYVGSSMVSGSDQALLHGHLDPGDEKRHKAFEWILAKSDIWLYLISSPMALLGGIIGYWSFRAAFLVQAVWMVIPIITVCLMEEKPYQKNSRSYIATGLEGIRVVWNTPLLRWIAIYSSFLMIGLSHIVYQPYFGLCQMPIWSYGLAYLGFNLFAAATLSQVKRLEKLLTGTGVLVAMGVTRVLTWVAMIAWQPQLGALFILGEQFTRALRRPVMDSLINKHIQDDSLRATVISATRQFDITIKLVLLPLLGYLMDQISFEVAVGLLLVVTVTGTAISLRKLLTNGL